MLCLTDGVSLSVLSGHHERGFSQHVDGVDLSVVTQQQLQTLHVICVRGGVERRPAEHTHTHTHTHISCARKHLIREETLFSPGLRVCGVYDRWTEGFDQHLSRRLVIIHTETETLYMNEDYWSVFYFKISHLIQRYLLFLCNSLCVML